MKVSDSYNRQNSSVSCKSVKTEKLGHNLDNIHQIIEEMSTWCEIITNKL